jgi:hypothetical protein
MFGFSSAEDAVAQSTGVLFPGLPDHARIVATLETHDTVAQVESTARRADGRPFRVRTAATLLAAAPGAGASVERVCLDLTDRQQLEGQLRLSRRLEAVGRLAVEMSDVVEPLLDRLDAGDHPADSGERRLAVLVRQLLTFSHRQGRPAGYLSLNDIIRRREPSLRQVLAETVTLDLALSEIEAVAAGEDDLSVLVTTLVHAATVCLPYGGTVRVTTLSDTEDLVLRTRLTVAATGYGALSTSLVSSLERLASRCGGTFRTSSEADHSISLHVHFPC